jgi:hypothetical protein
MLPFLPTGMVTGSHPRETWWGSRVRYAWTSVTSWTIRQRLVSMTLCSESRSARMALTDGEYEAATRYLLEHVNDGGKPWEKFQHDELLDDMRELGQWLGECADKRGHYTLESAPRYIHALLTMTTIWVAQNVDNDGLWKEALSKVMHR